MVVLELTMYTRSHRDLRLCLLSAGIKGVHQHVQLAKMKFFIWKKKFCYF